MTKKDDYGLGTPARSLPLLLFIVCDVDNRIPLNKLQVNKIICHFERLTLGNDIEFRPFKLGFVSQELSESLDQMLEYGLFDMDERGNYFLTEEGKEAATEIKGEYKKHQIDAMEEACRLRVLSTDEMLFFMYSKYPESRKNSTEYYRLVKKGAILVQGIYDKGIIPASVALSWVSDEDKDKLDLELNPDFIKKLESKKRERIVKSTEFLS